MSRTTRSKLRDLVVVALALTVPSAAPIAATTDEPARRGPAADATGVRTTRPATPPAAPRGADAATLPDAALASVQAAGGVLLEDGTTCPPERLLLSYRDPGDGWASGAYVSPLGPEPTAATRTVNGLALCSDSHHAFVGFEATWSGGAWRVSTVPDPAGGFASHDDEHSANAVDDAPLPAPVDPAARVVPAAGGPDIEGYAPYEPQVSCDPSPKAGALALRNLLLARYPATSSSGISRACEVGGRSEHKEGRAFDWAASVGNPSQRAGVEDLLAQLLATDEHGNRHALARRMGVMYVIWDHRIWSAERADAGWRPYSGSSPHTDHVHLSLSWAGALARTSFWSGTVVHGLPDRPVGGERVRGGIRFPGASDDTWPGRGARPDPLGDESGAGLGGEGPTPGFGASEREASPARQMEAAPPSTTPSTTRPPRPPRTTTTRPPSDDTVPPRQRDGDRDEVRDDRRRGDEDEDRDDERRRRRRERVRRERERREEERREEDRRDRREEGDDD